MDVLTLTEQQQIKCNPTIFAKMQLAKLIINIIIAVGTNYDEN